MRTILIAITLLLLAAHAVAAGVLVPGDGSEPIRVESQRVTVRIEDGIARTTVRQTFVNPHDRALQATYVFPLPETAALTDLAMEVGGRRLDGLLIERKTARRIYDSIVSRNRDPALLERIGRHAFRLSVFPVVPHEPTVVELSWVEALPLIDGRRTYTYPLALAGDASGRVGDLVFDCAVDSSVPFQDLRTKGTDLDLVRTSETTARATLERTDAVLDADLTFSYAVDVPEPRLDVRPYVSPEGQGYFAATLTVPRDVVADAKVLPRDLTLVIDTSGSMEGEKLDQARAALRHVIEHARAGDRVNVLRFSSDVEPFAERPVELTPENRAALLAFVDGLEAKGGTALGDAVIAGFAVPRAEGRVSTVVLLTDGEATVGETDVTKILAAARTDDAPRLYTFGVGTDVNAPFLDAVAMAADGRSEVFRAGGEIETRMRRFLARIASPVLTDVRLLCDGAVLHDVHPRPIPDVHLGEQVLFTGRFRGAGAAKFAVAGKVAGRELTIPAKVTLPASATGSPLVRDRFARQKTAFLERALRLRLGLSDDAYFAALDSGRYSTGDELIEEIVSLSLESGIQTSYTSFLALLPEDVARLDPRDADAVAEAVQRANAAKRELAGLPPREPRTEEDERTADAKEKADGGDPVIKDAKVSDHNETDNDMDTEEALGDPRFNSDAPFQGPGSNGTIGVGGGAGGAFGGRRGGHRNLKAGGGGKKTENAVDLALDWLARHQSDDGSWQADAYERHCEGPDNGGAGNPALTPATSGLATLSFLGYGDTHQQGHHKGVVKSALRYLKSIQGPDGGFGPRTSRHFAYNHACAALAMTEAYGLTSSRLFKDSAQRGVNFVLASQEPYLAWRHGLDDEHCDTELTGWMVMVLRSAHTSDLDVDMTSMKGALAWLDQVTDPATGQVGARPFDASAGTPNGSTDTLAAVGLTARIFAGQEPGTAPILERHADLVAGHPPVWDTQSGDIDFHRWYFATLGLFQMGGTRWKRWNDHMKAAIVDHQHTAAGTCARGSWDPVGPFGKTGGRVHSTALMCLCLEVYYRYGKVFGTGSPSGFGR